MSYFVTGGAGFIGRRLIRKLIHKHSTAAKGVKDDQSAASAEQIALAQFTRGIHW